jgi:hypothetical protein
VHSTQTNAAGDYTFVNVAPGSYWVKVNAPSPEYHTWVASDVTVASADVTHNADLPKKINLLSPASGSTTNNSRPTLTWTANPEAVRYELQLNVSNPFTVIENPRNISSNSYTVKTQLTSGTNFTWQVDGFDQANHRVGSTELAFNFTVITAMAGEFRLFGVTPGNSSSNPSTLLTIDRTNGAQALAGPVGQATNIGDLAWNPLTQTLFGSDQNSPNNRGVIQQIDPTRGNSVPVATIRQAGSTVNIFSLDFAADGTLWAVTGDQIATGLTLGVIDLATQTFSPRMTLPAGLVTGMATTPSGLLYAVLLHSNPFRQILVTIDLESLLVLSQRDLNSTLNVDDIAFAPDGFIYHTNFSGTVFRINPVSATVSQVGGGSLGALGGIAATGAVLGLQLSPQERIFSFDLSERLPGPPYQSIIWAFTFSSADPISENDVMITNLYGGPNGTQLVQSRRDTDFPNLFKFGGTLYGPLQTANPIFDPMLDGVFSFGLSLTSGSARVIEARVCGRKATGEEACTTFPIN